MGENIFTRKLKKVDTVSESESVSEPLVEPVVKNTTQKPKPEASDDLFVNTFVDINIIEQKNPNQKYEKINIIDLVNIKQEYDVILSAPDKTDSLGNKNSMFIQKTASKPIKGKNVVFDNFNMSIKDIVDRGQFVTILGKSGCGKSTLLRYICGLQQPTSGEIYLHGKKLEEKDKIPMVFQQYSSFPWNTVLENVALPLILKGIPKKEAFEKSMEMIKIVGLDGQEKKFAKYPILSGGQLQRVAIARNLVADPTTLLMDEPFGALDIITRRSMQVFMRKIFQDNNGVDPTVLLVTHDIREAIFLSNDIYILDANPAKIRCHIEIDLPDDRNINLKRDKRFLEYTDYVEDMMEKIEKEK
jgi:NitT/TauT family transport system ATP-binding protein